ncbi:MAG: LPS export ABC transporter periplasmic protein LptC [Legionella sp. 40-6]|nr:LPS export ABC transporter periplasmic protein LptC [Legionella sp.]OJY38344.1 MAG: LPS export ABC transporter periplasmic protein LptC [Legionella sp. 40-6]
MNINKQLSWGLLTLITLVCSGWYYSQQGLFAQLDSESLANSIESTITNLRVIQYKEDGSLANLLTTPQVQHIPKGDLYYFQKPHIIITQEDQPWDIRSVTAKSYDGGKRITFSGNVVVRQKITGSQDESILKTEEVTYFPQEKKASTDLLVTYEQPGNIIQSQGMNAYLEEKRVELLHQARGSYAPKNG